MTTTTVRPQHGSEVVKALEALWTAIRRNHPELPDVVMITGTGRTTWGHTGHDRWDEGDAGIGTLDTLTSAEQGGKTEMFIAGERLACGARLTAQTMLHEAAHVLAHARGLKDTSRQHRYHNRTFVALAEELGLAFPADTKAHPVIGFSDVHIRPETVTRYQSKIDALGKAIKLYVPIHPLIAALINGEGGDGTDPGTLLRPPKAPPTTPSRNLSVATCGCETPRKIRIAPRTLDLAPITCGACDQDFAY